MNLKPRLLYVPEGMNPPDDLRDACTFATHRVFVGRGLWNTDDAHNHPTSFTNLKAEYLRQFAPNYRKALDWLLANDYLQTDRKYVIGKKSIGYRIPAHHNIIRTPASTAMSCLINQEARNTYKHYTKAHKHLISWLPKFKLDTEGAKKHVAQLNREDGSSILTNEEFRDSVLCTVRLINDGEWACKVCHYGRFHSPYTRFLKELRGFVSYAGSSLVNIDICNSQPLMLTLLFPLSPLKNPKGSVVPLPIPTDSYTLQNSPSKANTSDESTVANDTISKCPETDMKQYQNLCESGGFYEYMMDVTGYTSRQQLKQDFFERVIFSTGKRDYELTKKFRGHFPSVWKVITDAKKGRGDQAYTQLAKRMQRAESRVMIDSLCYRLAEEYPEVPIITIHDSIMTTPEHTALIKRLMTEEFEKVGLHPTLKEEKYDPVQR